MMPKSYKWDSFKTLLYKNSFPKENGEIGACIDSDFISEFVKISFLAYEEEIFNIKAKTNDYVLFIKHKGCDYRVYEIDECFYKIKHILDDYVLVLKKHKDIALKIAYDDNISFEWLNKMIKPPYWQTGMEFFVTYNENLTYRIKR